MFVTLKWDERVGCFFLLLLFNTPTGCWCMQSNVTNKKKSQNKMCSYSEWFRFVLVQNRRKPWLLNVPRSWIRTNTPAMSQIPNHSTLAICLSKFWRSVWNCASKIHSLHPAKCNFILQSVKNTQNWLKFFVFFERRSQRIQSSEYEIKMAWLLVFKVNCVIQVFSHSFDNTIYDDVSAQQS